jgi:hypothetical protein
MKQTAILLSLLAVIGLFFPPAAAGTPAESLFSRLERIVPYGFAPSSPPQVFGTPDNKLKNGSIFDYMDGGGVAWLEHGFQELFHAEYAGQGDLTVTLDVFVMETAEKALAALADDRICPFNGAAAPFAPKGRVFRFPPDYYTYFPIGRHIVYLHVNDDRQSAFLDHYAVGVTKLLEENLK